MLLAIALQQYAMNTTCVVSDGTAFYNLITSNACATIHLYHSFSTATADCAATFNGTIAGNFYALSINAQTYFVQNLQDAFVKNLALSIEYVGATNNDKYAISQAMNSKFVNCIIKQRINVPALSLQFIYHASDVEFVGCRFELNVGDIGGQVNQLVRNGADWSISNCSFDITATSFCTLISCYLYAISPKAPDKIKQIRVLMAATGLLGSFYVFSLAPAPDYVLNDIIVEIKFSGYSTLNWRGVLAYSYGKVAASNISFTMDITGSTPGILTGLFGVAVNATGYLVELRDIVVNVLAFSGGGFAYLLTYQLDDFATVDLSNLSVSLSTDAIGGSVMLFDQLSNPFLTIKNYCMTVSASRASAATIYSVAKAISGTSSQYNLLKNVSVAISGAGSLSGSVCIVHTIYHTEVVNLTLDVALSGSLGDLSLFKASEQNFFADVHYYVAARSIAYTATSTSELDVFYRYSVQLALNSPSGSTFYGIAYAVRSVGILGFYCNAPGNVGTIYAIAYSLELPPPDPDATDETRLGVKNAFSKTTLVRVGRFARFLNVQVDVGEVGKSGHLSGLVEVCQYCDIAYIIAIYAFKQDYGMDAPARESLSVSAVCGECESSEFRALQVDFAFIASTSIITKFQPYFIGGVCARCYNFTIVQAQVRAEIDISASMSSDARYANASAVVGFARNNTVILRDIYYSVTMGSKQTCVSLIGGYDNTELKAQATSGGDITIEFYYIIDYSNAKCKQLPWSDSSFANQNAFVGTAATVKNFICARVDSSIGKDCNVNTTDTPDSELVDPEKMRFFVGIREPFCQPGAFVTEACDCYLTQCSTGYYCSEMQAACVSLRLCEDDLNILTHECVCGSSANVCAPGQFCSNGVCSDGFVGACYIMDDILRTPCFCYTDAYPCSMGDVCSTAASSCTAPYTCSQAVDAIITTACVCDSDTEACAVGEHCDVDGHCVPFVPFACGAELCTSNQECVLNTCMPKCYEYNKPMFSSCACGNYACGNNPGAEFCASTGCEYISICTNSTTPLLAPCIFGGKICEAGNVFDGGVCICRTDVLLQRPCQCGSNDCEEDEICTAVLTCEPLSYCVVDDLATARCVCDMNVCDPGYICDGLECVQHSFCRASKEALTYACFCFNDATICPVGFVCGFSHTCEPAIVSKPDYVSKQWVYASSDVPRLFGIINAYIDYAGASVLGSGYFSNSNIDYFLSNELDNMPYPAALPNFFRFHGRGLLTNPYGNVECGVNAQNDAKCTYIPAAPTCFSTCYEMENGECKKPFCHGECRNGVCECSFDYTMGDGDVRKVDFLEGEFCEAVVCTCLQGQVCRYNAASGFHLCETDIDDPLNSDAFDDVCNYGCADADTFACTKRKCSYHGYCFDQQCIGQGTGTYFYEFANFYAPYRTDIGDCIDRANKKAHNYNKSGEITLDFTCFSCIYSEAYGLSCDMCTDYTTHLNAWGRCEPRIDKPNWCFHTAYTVDNLTADELDRYTNSITGDVIQPGDYAKPNIHRNFTISPDKINDGYYCFGCENNESDQYKLLDNICYLLCGEEHCYYGECYYLNRGRETPGTLDAYNYFCLDGTCVCDEYNDLGVCVSAKKIGRDYNERKKCVVELEDPHGFCYDVNGYHRCICDQAVFNGSTIVSPDYYYLAKNCYEKCYTERNYSAEQPICWFGECYFYIDSLDYFCNSCSVNATGERCSVCTLDQVHDDHRCYYQVNKPHQCYNNVTIGDSCYCIDCADGFILSNNKCLQQCNTGACKNGNCYYISSDKSYYNCTSCYDGNLRIEVSASVFKCFTIIDNYYGDCYINDNRETICDCYQGFWGSQCEQFDGIYINDSVFMKDPSYNGDCYYSYLDPSVVVCITCHSGYELPLCKYCAEGYHMSEAGICDECVSNFVPAGTIGDAQLVVKVGAGACVSLIYKYQRGKCYYHSGAIVCTSCYDGYDISHNCEKCVVGYTQVGALCVEGSQICGYASIGGVKQYVCPGCAKYMDDQCTGCASDSVEYKETCAKRASIAIGDCAQDGGNIICMSQNDCLEATANQTDPLRLNCTKCAPGLYVANGSCHTRLVTDGIYYHGECYEELLYEHAVSCVSCEPGWTGFLCHVCASGATYCNCNQLDNSYCCCYLVDYKTGLCYSDLNGVKRCVQCLSGYSMVNYICVKTKRPPLFMIWVGLLLLLLAVIIVLIIYYYRLSSFQQFRLRRRIKFALKSAGMYVLYTVLAYVCSFIIAIYDVYIDSISFQFAVIFYGSIPFAVMFMAFYLPKRRHYFLKAKYDILKFSLAVSTDIVFNCLLYYGIPDYLGVGQSIFKAMVAPACLLCFVFFAGYKFTTVYVWFALAAAVIPTVYYLYSSISNSGTPGFFQGLSSGAILLGVFFIVCDIIVVTLQMYVYEIVLDVYDEIEALLLVSMFYFVFYGLMTLFYMRDYLPILKNSGFAVCVVTQILYNILQIFIMAGISSTEFSINCVSSAVWVEMIQAIGTYIVARGSGVACDLRDVIITVAVFVCVIMCLVAFSAAHNPMLSNDEASEPDEDNGVRMALFKSRKQRENAKPSHAPTVSAQFLKDALQKIARGMKKNVVVEKHNKDKYQLQQRAEPKQILMEELLVSLTSTQDFVFKPVRSNGRVINIEVDRDDNMLDYK